MQEDNAMFDKILGDLQRILNNDVNSRLKSFSIVHVTENKNKSPIIYEQNDGIEHHLGLESWCVKHIYKYVYDELFKVRRLLKKNRLPAHKMEALDKFLVGALLINPEVVTFWNMKRELVEEEILQIEKELSFTRIVLSHKPKSNETFGYRRWLLKRLFNSLKPENRLDVLTQEFEVTATASEKAENNYHSWTHRIWCLENAMPERITPVCIHYDRVNRIVSQQLNYSLLWINKHVSQHTGFHYRQFFINFIGERYSYSSLVYSNYFMFVKCLLHIDEISDEAHFLCIMLGDGEDNFCGGDFSNSYNVNCSSYVCILLYDLCHTLKKLFRFYAKHETVWYHRRFIIYHFLRWIHARYGIDWKPNVKIVDVNCRDTNIVDACINDSVHNNNLKFAENGEKSAKLFKSDTDKLESSLVYRTVLRTESEVLEKSLSDDCPLVRKLAERYNRWLKNVVCLRGL